MIKSKYNCIKISGVSAAVSTKWESLAESAVDEDIQEFNINKFIKTTGVKGRYVASKMQTTSDFCYAAAKGILEKCNLSIDDIGAIVFVSQCSDYTTPATACVLQKRLGGKKPDCIAFDVNLGCSGYIYGLNILSGLMTNSDVDKGLLLCGDTFAKPYYHNRDVRESHSSKYLFGDAGTATILAKDNKADELYFASCTNGNGYSSIIEPFNHWRHPDKERSSSMDDISVFNFSTTEAPIMIKEYMKDLQRTPDDYDMLVLHQANKMIMKQITKRSGFSEDKMAVSIDEYGNTSSASIPLTLVKYYGGDESEIKKKFLTCGYGVGLSWAAAELNIAPSQILPVIHTDEYYNDGYED